MRVHLVYPHKRVGHTPYSIGWKVADALASRYETFVYDWHETVKIQPRQGDVLVGHPHPFPGTVLRRSWTSSGWSRRIVLAPFAGSLHANGFEDSLVRSSDSFLAICGRPWAESLKFSHFRSWLPKFVQLDLAVDMRDYPRLLSSFRPAGARRVLYLGHSAFYKDPAYLEAIRAQLPDVDFGWIGGGERQVRGFRRHGVIRSDTDRGRQLIGEYDFLLMAGSNDANPTTVLEAMAWGLIPIATSTSGYDSRDGVVEIPSGDARGAASVIQDWVCRSEASLLDLQSANYERLTNRFTWDRLTSSVLEEVQKTDSMEPIEAWVPDRVVMLAGALSSPFLLNRGMIIPPARSLLKSGPRSRTAWCSGAGNGTSGGGS